MFAEGRGHSLRLGGRHRDRKTATALRATHWVLLQRLAQVSRLVPFQADAGAASAGPARPELHADLGCVRVGRRDGEAHLLPEGNVVLCTEQQKAERVRRSRTTTKKLRRRFDVVLTSARFLAVREIRKAGSHVCARCAPLHAAQLTSTIGR